MSDEKIIVTHKNPDLDAIGSVWLLKKYGGKEFENAKVIFVKAGDTFRKAEADIDEDIVHVDTGGGRFDHHDTAEKTAAAELVYKDLLERHKVEEEDVALVRVVKFLVETDHFGAFHWPEPTNDRYLFMLEQILNGIKLGGHGNDTDLVRIGMECLDGVYSMMNILVEAEDELKEGVEFKTKFGKGLGLKSQNDATLKLAQKKGYMVVIRKDPEEGNIRIKAAPVEGIDLSEVYKHIKKKDKKGTWFFHASGKMILNGSSKSPGQVPSDLSLEEVIGILKSA